MAAAVGYLGHDASANIVDSLRVVSYIGIRGVLYQAIIRSAKQDDIYGASNIVLPCPGS